MHVLIGIDLFSIGTAEGAMNFPTQQEGDGHSTTVETLNYPDSVLAGNIQIGDTVDLTGKCVTIFVYVFD